MRPMSRTAADQKSLKEKKSPQSSLSIDENVELHHIQFNESFAEMNRSMNKWQKVAGATMLSGSFTALILIWEKHYVYFPAPHTSEEEWAAKQTKRMLDVKVSPIQGFSAKWDYDKNEWKKEEPATHPSEPCLLCHLHAAPATVVLQCQS
ncbi:cytochrome c oxidase subunit 4 isoform 1, mitochondrial-like [Ursus maritimus]|uniref:Cytochrome c oxidase subunit 4 n=1 Tax=Ursus maritimus TaxID=29073 RepID=A0A8M1GHA2_URSMA|nr:cytochrome c oxidase subunit 4 isoform 1, mitochondrial-like [Ursus maritimus]